VLIGTISEFQDGVKGNMTSDEDGQRRRMDQLVAVASTNPELPYLSYFNHRPNSPNHDDVMIARHKITQTLNGIATLLAVTNCIRVLSVYPVMLRELMMPSVSCAARFYHMLNRTWSALQTLNITMSYVDDSMPFCDNFHAPLLETLSIESSMSLPATVRVRTDIAVLDTGLRNVDSYLVLLRKTSATLRNLTLNGAIMSALLRLDVALPQLQKLTLESCLLDNAASRLPFFAPALTSLKLLRMQDIRALTIFDLPDTLTELELSETGVRILDVSRLTNLLSLALLQNNVLQRILGMAALPSLTRLEVHQCPLEIDGDMLRNARHVDISGVAYMQSDALSSLSCQHLQFANLPFPDDSEEARTLRARARAKTQLQFNGRRVRKVLLSDGTEMLRFTNSMHLPGSREDEEVVRAESEQIGDVDDFFHSVF